MDPDSLAYGDLNGDGRVDLIWISVTTTSTVGHVELAQAGGGYLAGPTFTIPTTPNSIPQCVTADVTQDGKLDIICGGLNTATAVATVFVFPGNGDGTLAPPVSTQYGSQYSQGIILSAVGDLNKDGVPDFILVDDYYNVVLVLLSDGKGGFLPAKSAPTGYNYSVPFVADINGDGIPDLLWPEGAGVALGKGDGSFGNLLAPTVSPSIAPIYCAFHDMDGDGKLDAVCGYISQGSDLDILHGNGDGTFNPTPIFHQTFGSASILRSGTGDFLIPEIVSDVNGDGIPDILAFGGDGLTVLLGKPGLTFAAPSEYALASVGYAESFPAPGQRAYVDLNGDGLLDVLAAGPNGLYLLYGHPDGTFGSALATKVSELNGHIAVADFNGDGKPDLISSGAPQASVLLGHGDGTFASPVPVLGSPFAPGATIFVADFNGDGKADLLSSDVSSNHYLMLGKGDGTFGAAIATSGLPTSLASGSVTDNYTAAYALTADLNGDAKSDVFFIQTNSTSSTYSLVSALSAGDGSFRTVSTTYASPLFEGGPFYSTPVAQVLGDFGHSGKLDAAYVLGGSIDVVRGSGDGSFSATPTVLSIPTVAGAPPNEIQAMQVGDLDGDGNLDLVFLSWFQPGGYSYQGGPSCVFIYFGKGDGTFTTPSQAGCFTHAYTDVRVADVNVDGRPDIVLQTASSLNDYVVGVIDNLGGRTFGPEMNYTAGSLSGDFIVTDLNLDGRPDLVFGNQRYEAGYSANSVTVLLNTIPPVLTASPTTTTLTCTPATIALGADSQLLSTVSSSSGTPTGSVTFTDNGSFLSTRNLTNGSTDLAYLGQQAGAHTVTAAYPATGNFGASFATCSITVVAVPMVTGTLTASPEPSAAAAPYNLTAALMPPVPGPALTGNVTFAIDGATIGSAALSGNAATLPGPQTLAYGVHQLTATWPGNSTYPAVSLVGSHTVTADPLIIALTTVPNPSTVGQSVTFTAAFTGSYAGSGGYQFTGTLSFYDGTTLLGQQVPSVSGFSYTTSSLAIGSHSIQAIYKGDPLFSGATSNTVVQIVNGLPTTSVLTVAPSSTTYGTPFTLSAAVAPTTPPGQGMPSGTVAFYYGNTSLGSAPLNTAGVATFSTLATLPAGNYAFTCAYLGATPYAGSPCNVVNATVAAAPEALTLTSSLNPAYQGQPVTLTVAANAINGTYPSGAVTFLDGTSALGSASFGTTGQASFTTTALAIGTHPISVTLAAAGNFGPATSNTVQQVILPSTFAIALAPPSVTLQAGQQVSVQIQLASIGTFAGPLTLSYGPLPTYATAAIAPATVTLTSGGTGTATLTLKTEERAHNDRPTRPGSRTLPVTVLAGAMLLLHRRRRVRRWLSLCLFACLLQGLTGCTNAYYELSVVKPGTYQLPVTATDTNSNTHTALLTVTVTP